MNLYPMVMLKALSTVMLIILCNENGNSLGQKKCLFGIGKATRGNMPNINSVFQVLSLTDIIQTTWPELNITDLSPAL